MTDPNMNPFPWSLDWNLLRTFTVVVEQEGITRAANFLGVKQPTISNAVSRLEKTVQCRLLERRPNYFRVTAMGRKLYAECSSLFGAISQLPDILTRGEDAVTGHISAAMASHVVCPHFDSVLAAFNRQHPDITYSFDVVKSAEVANRVRQNRISFGICLLYNKEPRLEKRILYREFFGLFCGPGHRFYKKRELALTRVEQEDAVAFLPDIENGAQHYISQLFKRVSLSPKIKGVSTNLPEIRRMMVANIGIGCLPVHVARKDVEAGRIWQLPPYTALPSLDVHLLTNPSRSRNPAETVFLDRLTSHMATTPIEERTYT